MVPFAAIYQKGDTMLAAIIMLVGCGGLERPKDLEVLGMKLGLPIDAEGGKVKKIDHEVFSWSVTSTDIAMSSWVVATYQDRPYFFRGKSGDKRMPLEEFRTACEERWGTDHTTEESLTKETSGTPLGEGAPKTWMEWTSGDETAGVYWVGYPGTDGYYGVDYSSKKYAPPEDRGKGI